MQFQIMAFNNKNNQSSIIYYFEMVDMDGQKDKTTKRHHLFKEEGEQRYFGACLKCSVFQYMIFLTSNFSLLTVWLLVSTMPSSGHNVLLEVLCGLKLFFIKNSPGWMIKWFTQNGSSSLSSMKKVCWLLVSMNIGDTLGFFTTINRPFAGCSMEKEFNFQIIKYSFAYHPISKDPGCCT